MNITAYNTITAVLVIGVLVASVAAVCFFAAMVWHWKTSKRRRQVLRLLVSLAVIPCLIGLQQAILWQVFLPAMALQQMAVLRAMRDERIAETSLVKVGDISPTFSLTTSNGQELSVPTDDSVVLINFFATWCGPCQLELPYIEEIWEENKDTEHFRLVVISREETTEIVQQYCEEKGFSFPVSVDPDRAIYSLFATGLIPRTLVVSPDGQIVYSKAGFLEGDIEELRAVLKEQLASVE